jgi:hypothetical protein
MRKKTLQNPHGLTYKQDLVIKDAVSDIEMGKSMNLAKSVEKFYNVKNRKSTSQVIRSNMQNKNFREALIESLVDKKILGANSLTENRLLEGLDAETKDGFIDYDVRLKYVQEINKVAGVYAPERKATMNLNVDMSEEELDKHIKELTIQLGG